MDKENISSLLDEASEVILVVDKQGGLVFSNEAARRFFSENTSSVYSLFDAQVCPSLEKYLSGQNTNAPRPLAKNALAVHQDGTQRPVSVLLSHVSKQEPQLFMIVLEELLPTDDLEDFQQVANRSDDALSIYGHQLRCVFANPAVTKLGASSADEYQRSGGFLGSIIKEDQATTRRLLDTAIAKRQSHVALTYHTQPSDGLRMLISNQVQLTYHLGGSLAYLIAREAPRTATTTDELFILANPDLTIDYISSNCFVYLGYTPQEVTQQCTLRDLLSSKDWTKLLTLVEDNTTISTTMSLPLKHRNGESLVATAHLKPFFSNQNQLTYTVIRLTDITKQAADILPTADASVAALVKAKEAAEQAMKSREAFISTMSHEIRTPLNAIVGITDLLLANAPPPEQRKLLETLKFSSDNLSALVNDVLSHSKLEAGTISFERQTV